MALDTETLAEVRESSPTYQAGNEADFERLYNASYGKILGTVNAMLGDRAAAEDCVQDAFERAYKKWPTWEPIAPAEAWVHRIAINAAVSYTRKMRIREVGACKAATQTGRGDRAPALPRVHEPSYRAGIGHPRADRRVAAGRRQGAPSRDAEGLIWSRGGHGWPTKPVPVGCCGVLTKPPTGIGMRPSLC